MPTDLRDLLRTDAVTVLLTSSLPPATGASVFLLPQFARDGEVFVRFADDIGLGRYTDIDQAVVPVSVDSEQLEIADVTVPVTPAWVRAAAGGIEIVLSPTPKPDAATLVEFLDEHVLELRSAVGVPA